MLSANVIMPALGMAQETGTVLRWRKAPGESVVKGEPLMEVETDKVTVEIEAPASGVLCDVTASAGDEVPVGQVIAVIRAPDEAAPSPHATDRAVEAGEQVPAATAASAPGSTSTARVAASPLAARIAAQHDVDLRRVEPAGERIKKDDVLEYLAAQGAAVPTDHGAPRIAASPKARRLASEMGISLAQLAGTGPQGAVLTADVLAAATTGRMAGRIAYAPTAADNLAAPAAATTKRVPYAPTAAVPAQAEEPSGAMAATEEATPLAAGPAPVEMSATWRTMAERTTRSWTGVPHFYVHREVHAGGLVAWRESAQRRLEQEERAHGSQERGTKITYTDLLVKLVAAALRAHPRLNAAFEHDTITLHDEVNVGLAVAVEDGLIVPVIHGADRLGLRVIAERRHDLVARAQAGTLRPDDVRGGTFTISNLGMYGVDSFSAIVNPPQAAILAAGRIAERVVPVNGQPAVRPMLDLTLSCDHRVVDGARAALFLSTLAAFIEEPLALVD